MKNTLVALLAGAALMACAPASETAPETPAAEPTAAAPSTTPEPLPQPPATDPTAPGADACGAAQYASLVGKPITEPACPLKARTSATSGLARR